MCSFQILIKNNEEEAAGVQETEKNEQLKSKIDSDYLLRGAALELVLSAAEWQISAHRGFSRGSKTLGQQRHPPGTSSSSPVHCQSNHDHLHT